MESAWRAYRELSYIESQVAEVATPLAARVGAWAGRLDWAQEMADHYAAFPLKGAWSLALLTNMRAAIAALDGRTDEAVTSYRRGIGELRALGMDYVAALAALDFAVLLPAEPGARALADEARVVFERVQARVWLERLDHALARQAPTDDGQRAGAGTAAAPRP
jgi:hypothetical protein